MTFRSVEIHEPADIHIRSSILQIEQNDQKLQIPLEDINVIIASGPDIRLSTNDLAQLAIHDVLLMVVDNHYDPASMTLSFVNNSRQPLTMKKQLSLSKRRRNDLWNHIVVQKIRNQAFVLQYTGKDGFREIYDLSHKVVRGDRDNAEGTAASRYFQYYHPGLNRRCEDPLNSCLNYGYAVIRSAVARSAAMHGFLLADGIHHRNTFNAFNLVDDLLEPFRPVVDLVACRIVSSNVKLTKDQRKTLMGILYLECRIDQQTTTVINAIDIMVSSIKAWIFCNSEEISLPELLPVKEKGSIQE